MGYRFGMSKIHVTAAATLLILSSGKLPLCVLRMKPINIFCWGKCQVLDLKQMVPAGATAL
jgi:hypothetical protein